MASREDELLKRLTEEDIPEGCLVLVDFLRADIKELSNEIVQAPYYQGDGLDLIRYLIKNFGGLTFRLPRKSSLRNAHKRYIKERLSAEPGLNIRRIAVEMDMDERTVRGYVEELKREGAIGGG